MDEIMILSRIMLLVAEQAECDGWQRARIGGICVEDAGGVRASKLFISQQ